MPPKREIFFTVEPPHRQSMAPVSFLGVGKELPPGTAQQMAATCPQNWGDFTYSPAILLAESHVVPSTCRVIESQVQA